MSEGFEDFGLNEDGINVTDRPNILSFNGFDSKFFSSHFMHS